MAHVEERFNNTGFVYTDKSRFLFYSVHMMFESPNDIPRNAIVVGNAKGWPEVSSAGEMYSICKALEEYFPNSVPIYCDTDGGLTRISTGTKRPLNQE
jgi:hypothetical protein